MVHAGNSMKEVRQNAVAPLGTNQKDILSNDVQKRTPSGLNYLHQLLCHSCSERKDILVLAYEKETAGKPRLTQDVREVEKLSTHMPYLESLFSMYTLISFIYLDCSGKLQFQLYSLFPNFSIKFPHKSKILDFINLVTPYFYFLFGNYRVWKHSLPNICQPFFWKPF